MRTITLAKLHRQQFEIYDIRIMVDHYDEGIDDEGVPSHYCHIGNIATRSAQLTLHFSFEAYCHDPAMYVDEDSYEIEINKYGAFPTDGQQDINLSVDDRVMDEELAWDEFIEIFEGLDYRQAIVLAIATAELKCFDVDLHAAPAKQYTKRFDHTKKIQFTGQLFAHASTRDSIDDTRWESVEIYQTYQNNYVTIETNHSRWGGELTVSNGIIHNNLAALKHHLSNHELVAQLFPS